MPVNKSSESMELEVSLIARKTLILKQPIFATLPDYELSALASIAFEKKYHPHEIIVSEGDYIDAVYLIVHGEVEVGTEVNAAGEVNRISITTLKEGDAIGLGKENFFSKSGTRTTTVAALTNVLLLGWKLEDFYNFLTTHPVLGNAMQEAAKFFLRMNFVKQVASFSDLSPQRIALISQNIQEKFITKGSIIFREGEEGEECYLIYSGRVEIFVNNEDGTEKSLAILEPPTLFGEIAALTASPRNATARMKESGELFVLQKNQLQELLHYQATTAESIVLLMISRSRPLRVPYISYYHRTTSDGRTITILKNSKLWRYYLLSEAGWLIWQQLDGRQTIEDIIMVLLTEHKIFVPDEVSNTVLNLANSGFVTLPAMSLISSPVPPIDQSKWGRIKHQLFKKLYIRYAFKDIDEVLTKSYNFGVHFLFNPIAQSLIAITMLIGMGYFFSFSHQDHDLASSITAWVMLILGLVFTNILLVPLHELGHAYTTKAFGQEIHYAGIILSPFGLVAFIDTTDMCLSTKKNRIIVNLAGAYTDLCLGAIASLVAHFAIDPGIKLFFWLLAFMLYYSVIRNLNPISQGDGYYVLSDVLENPKLHYSAFNWLSNLQVSALFSRKFLSHNKEIIIFWATSFALLLVALGLTIFAQFMLLSYLPHTLLGISTYYLSWILPGLVIIRFVGKIVVSFKKLGLKFKGKKKV